MIEYDIPKSDDLEFYIKNNFNFKDGAEEIEPEIRITNDELVVLKYKGLANLYIDTYHNRIWNVYSLGNSKVIDKIINKVSNSVYFDKVWFPHDFLLSLKNRENTKTRGFGLNFDYRKFESDEDISPVLKMQLSGINTASTVFKILQNVPELRDNITLSKIKLKTYNSESDSRFILEDVNYNGKISARGTDITQHISNTLSLKKNYFEILKNIEANYRIGWRNIDGRFRTPDLS